MDDYPSLNFLYAETRDLLIRQLTYVDGIDTKASILAGFDGLIITASLAVLKDIRDIALNITVGLASYIFVPLVVAGLLMAIVSLGLALYCYRIGEFKEVLNPTTTREKWLCWPEDKSKQQLLDNLVEAYRLNEKAIARKISRLNLSLYALLMASVSFALVAIVYLARL